MTRCSPGSWGQRVGVVVARVVRSTVVLVNTHAHEFVGVASVHTSGVRSRVLCRHFVRCGCRMPLAAIG
jgi:hypothetical protein